MIWWGRCWRRGLVRTGPYTPPVSRLDAEKTSLNFPNLVGQLGNEQRSRGWVEFLSVYNHKLNRTNPNEVLPAKDKDKYNIEENKPQRSVPSQICWRRRGSQGWTRSRRSSQSPGYDEDDDEDNDDGEEDDGDDNDLMSCAPRSIPGGQLHRTEPVKRETLGLFQLSQGEGRNEARYSWFCKIRTDKQTNCQSLSTCSA